jgi:hypothetical protein
MSFCLEILLPLCRFLVARKLLVVLAEVSPGHDLQQVLPLAKL